MFAIMWGTIAVVLLLSFGQGLKDRMVAGFSNNFNNVLLVFGGTTSKKFEGLPKGRSIRLQIEDISLLKSSIPEIQKISPSFGKWGTMLETRFGKRTTYMEGVYPSFEDLRNMFPGGKGRFLNYLDEKYKRKVVFLGNEIAEDLFKGHPAVGKSVDLDGVPFTVIGVMEPKLQTSMNNGPDADRAIIPASTFKAIYGTRYVNQILIRPHSVTENEVTEDAITKVLASRYKFDPSDENAITVWDTIKQAQQLYMMLFGVQIFLGVIGLFTLLVAGVGIANIMYVVVKERTREIGVKLAVGARKIHIMIQFLFEALTISLLGGAIGLGISVAIIMLVRQYPAGDGPMRLLAHPELSVPIALTCTIVLVMVGFLAGFFPAQKAAGLDPVESLRYE